MDKYKGWGPWRCVWASACSRHQKPDAACRMCKNGVWANLWWMALENWAFELSPTLWRRWANRGRKSSK